MSNDGLTAEEKDIIVRILLQVQVRLEEAPILQEIVRKLTLKD
jgi:hypothetical protein